MSTGHNIFITILKFKMLEQSIGGGGGGHVLVKKYMDLTRIVHLYIYVYICRCGGHILHCPGSPSF